MAAVSLGRGKSPLLVERIRGAAVFHHQKQKSVFPVDLHMNPHIPGCLLCFLSAGLKGVFQLIGQYYAQIAVFHAKRLGQLYHLIVKTDAAFLSLLLFLVDDRIQDLVSGDQHSIQSRLAKSESVFVLISIMILERFYFFLNKFGRRGKNRGLSFLTYRGTFLGTYVKIYPFIRL